MADHAAAEQFIPIVVRKPRMVWPGLDKEGLYHKSIAGDGKQDLVITALSYLTDFHRQLPLCIPF